MSDHDYRPSAAAYRRAAAAGRDLDELRHSDPQSFRMFSAEEACRISAALAPAVGETFFAIFPDHELYQVPDTLPERLRLLAFPPLGPELLRRWEAALAGVAARWPELPVYFRVVEDVRGVRRELALPLSPDAWQGHVAVVGPFGTRDEAAEFGRRASAAADLAFDCLPLGEWWLCDLFLLEDPDLATA